MPEDLTTKHKNERDARRRTGFEEHAAEPDVRPGSVLRFTRTRRKRGTRRSASEMCDEHAAETVGRSASVLEQPGRGGKSGIRRPASTSTDI